MGLLPLEFTDCLQVRESSQSTIFILYFGHWSDHSPYQQIANSYFTYLVNHPRFLLSVPGLSLLPRLPAQPREGAGANLQRDQGPHQGGQVAHSGSERSAQDANKNTQFIPQKNNYLGKDSKGKS